MYEVGPGSVVIDHHNVPGYGPLATWYRHLDDIKVSARQPVEAGSLLGYMGHVDTDLAHLHFATSTNTADKWGVDPATLLSQWKAAGSSPHTPMQPPPSTPTQPEVFRDVPWLLILLAIALLSQRD